MNESRLGKLYLLIITIALLALGVGGIVVAYVLSVLDLIKEFWNYFLTIAGAIFLFVGLLCLYRLLKNDKAHLTVKQMSMVGIMSAITVVLYYFVKFPLPFFAPWLDIQVSELPALITGFAYGPFAGCLVILVRFIIKLPATITAGVGELADLLLGLVVVGLSSFIYKKHRTLKGALTGTAISMGTGVVLSAFINWLVLIPAFIYIAGFNMNALVGMLNSIYPSFEVTSSNFMLVYVFLSVVPFNLLRYIIVFILTFVLYKRTHKILQKITK